MSKAIHDKKKQTMQNYWKEELQTSVARPWRRAKVMFVGEGRAGKTSALRSLLDLPFRDTASTVGADMFDVSVETAVRWSRQDRNVPEIYRVAARWAAWRNEHGGKMPPGVAAASTSPNNRVTTSEAATGMASAAPAIATGGTRSGLRSLRQILCVQYLSLVFALQEGRSMLAYILTEMNGQLLQQMPQALHVQTLPCREVN